jgi:hypothetical protein
MARATEARTAPREIDPALLQPELEIHVARD